jgi:transcriptional regulator with XRE-family HTH domain
LIYKEVIIVTVGEKIRALREAQGVTQEELATAIGTQKQAIYKYENNIVTNIPLKNIEQIAIRLRTTPAYLTGWEEGRNLDESGKIEGNEALSFALYGRTDIDEGVLDDVRRYAAFVAERKKAGKNGKST